MGQQFSSVLDRATDVNNSNDYSKINFDDIDPLENYRNNLLLAQSENDKGKDFTPNGNVFRPTFTDGVRNPNPNSSMPDNMNKSFDLNDPNRARHLMFNEHTNEFSLHEVHEGFKPGDLLVLTRRPTSSMRSYIPYLHLEDLQRLRKYKWYVGEMNRFQSVDILSKSKTKKHLVRHSSTYPGKLVLSVKVTDIGIKHYLINKNTDGLYSIWENPKYPTLPSLVEEFLKRK